MNWEDECYLLSKRKFRENANIINVFSQLKLLGDFFGRTLIEGNGFLGLTFFEVLFKDFSCFGNYR